MSKLKFNNKEIVRCTYCGRFISQKDIERGNVKFEHTPDTAYSMEETLIICPKCNGIDTSQQDNLFNML